MLWIAREARMNSKVTFSYGLLHIDTLMLADQFYADTGCCLEDPLREMANWKRWRERECKGNPCYQHNLTSPSNLQFSVIHTIPFLWEARGSYSHLFSIFLVPLSGLLLWILNGLLWINISQIFLFCLGKYSFSLSSSGIDLILINYTSTFNMFLKYSLV